MVPSRGAARCAHRSRSSCRARATPSACLMCRYARTVPLLTSPLLSQLPSSFPGAPCGAFVLFSRFNLAGAVGFEPTSPVLETGSLAIELRPLHKSSLPGPTYFTSLCAVCLRHLRQNLLNSRRSVVVFLFLVVE